MFSSLKKMKRSPDMTVMFQLKMSIYRRLPRRFPGVLPVSVPGS